MVLGDAGPKCLRCLLPPPPGLTFHSHLPWGILEFCPVSGEAREHRALKEIKLNHPSL